MLLDLGDKILDLSTSCTKNVAIGKLLGIYPNDPIQPNNYPESDQSDDDQQYGDEIECTVFDDISYDRSAAQCEKDDAIEAKDQLKKDECNKRIMHCETQMRLGHQYLCEIDNELAKGESSMLRIDPVATKTPDNPYITLVSLNEWAQSKYKINIFDNNTLDFIGNLLVIIGNLKIVILSIWLNIRKTVITN